MTQATRHNLAPIALLVLLGLLVLLLAKRKDLTAKEAEEDAVRTIVNFEEEVERDRYATVAFVGVVALCTFLVWMAIRAGELEQKDRPSAQEPGSGSRTTFL